MDDKIKKEKLKDAIIKATEETNAYEKLANLKGFTLGYDQFKEVNKEKLKDAIVTTVQELHKYEDLEKDLRLLCNPPAQYLVAEAKEKLRKLDLELRDLDLDPELRNPAK